MKRYLPKEGDEDSSGDVPRVPVSPSRSASLESQSAPMQADSHSAGSVDSPRQLRSALSRTADELARQPSSRSVSFSADVGQGDGDQLNEEDESVRGGRAMCQESGDDVSYEVGGVIVSETPPSSDLHSRNDGVEESSGRTVGADPASVPDGLESSVDPVELHECSCGEQFAAIDELQIHQVCVHMLCCLL